jgi:hypothetical protein
VCLQALNELEAPEAHGKEAALAHWVAILAAISITAASKNGLGAEEKPGTGVLPRWKLEKGTATAYEFERDFKFAPRTGDGKALPGAPSPEQVIKLDLRFTFLAVEGDSGARVNCAVERVQLEIRGIPGEVFHFDSDQRERSTKPRPEQAALVKVLDQLRAAPLEFSASTAGEIKDVRLPADLAAALERRPSPFVEVGALLSATGLEQVVKEIFVTFPAKPVKEGDSWRQVVACSGTGKPGWKYDDDLTYRGPKPGGAALDLIQMKRRASVEDGDAPQDQESKGELIFDRQAGCLEQFELRHRMRIVTSRPLPDGSGKSIKTSLAFDSTDKIKRRKK